MKTSRLFIGLAIIGLGGGYPAFADSALPAHPAAPCETPSGTWKDNCGAWHTLTKDEKGCSFTATCEEKDHFYTWPVTAYTPALHYCGEGLQPKACSAA